MRAPFIRRRSPDRSRESEHGATMALVAIAMVGVIAMAAVSIDIGTLYEASAEAQRSADAAALAAARTIAVSGLTTDPNNTADWAPICGIAASQATQAAIATAHENSVAGASNLVVTVTYSATSGAATGSDCTAVGAPFATNPLVTVTVKQSNMPVYFLRLWGTSTSSVSATATAEAFNSSSPAGNSSIYATSPRCVKPWVVPNLDPDHGGATPQPFITTTGSIQNPALTVAGVIGETFTLTPDCSLPSGNCVLYAGQPQANPAWSPFNPSLAYVPGQISNSTGITAIPACTATPLASSYAQAIAGCDQSTQYQCGMPLANNVDLSENPVFPGGNGDTTNGAECLIHQAAGTASVGNGQDFLAPGTIPPDYPFQIKSGLSNPLVAEGLTSGNAISSSTSIVTVPVYNQTGSTIVSGGVTQVTIVGFLQVFINYVDGNGDVNVTVMNVVGCGSAPTTVFNGTSPVPVRLINH